MTVSSGKIIMCKKNGSICGLFCMVFDMLHVLYRFRLKRYVFELVHVFRVLAVLSVTL